jgi:hypothetical protein
MDEARGFKQVKRKMQIVKVYSSRREVVRLSFGNNKHINCRRYPNVDKRERSSLTMRKLVSSYIKILEP